MFFVDVITVMDLKTRRLSWIIWMDDLMTLVLKSTELSLAGGREMWQNLKAEAMREA